MTCGRHWLIGKAGARLDELYLSSYHLKELISTSIRSIRCYSKGFYSTGGCSTRLCLVRCHWIGYRPTMLYLMVVFGDSMSNGSRYSKVLFNRGRVRSRRALCSTFSL